MQQQYLHGIYLLMIMTSFLFLQSCVDEIELDVPKGQIDAVAVNGRLLIGDDIEIVVVTRRIFSFDGTSTILRVKKVNLINEKGDQLALDFIAEGTFYKQIKPTDQFEIVSDMSFKINVELFDGRLFESMFETYISFDTSDLSVSVKRNENETVDINLQTEINNSQNNSGRFRWVVNSTVRIEDNPEVFGINDRLPTICYVTRPLNTEDQIFFDGSEAIKETIIFDGKVFSGNIDDWITKDTMYFNVLQESLSEGAFEFLNQVDLTNALDGSMFQPAAGKIKTNLINVTNPDEEVFGYFYVTEQTSTDIMLTPGQLGIEVESTCKTPPPMSFTPDDCIYYPCCSCWFQANSSLTKPDYWK